jgi:UDP-galactopyranose mutase
MESDYLIIGSGLTGAVIARKLADAGKSVLVLERRSHLGGNVHDHFHASGIRVHTYGPHYFRTNDEDLWRFVNRFAEFYKYEAAIKSFVDDAYENWPVTGSYVQRIAGKDWKPVFTGPPANFEEASLAMMPEIVYEKFVKGYTEKQWGVPARTLSAQLARRFDVRADDETRLMRHKFQGLPKAGYAGLMRNLLDGIRVILDCDYLRHKNEFSARAGIVFTGPIDEFFSCDLGHLKYRGQKREQEFLPDIDFAQPCAQVNNPDPANGPHLRTLEWKHMMEPADARRISGTVLTRETTITPADANDFEYPFPDAANAQLCAAYRERAQKITGLLICGRLGEYRYYDMDQAIARALILAERLLNGNRADRREILPTHGPSRD